MIALKTKHTVLVAFVATAVATYYNFVEFEVGVKVLIRKALLALGFPKIETRHPHLGVYEVGAIKIRLSPELPTVQLFYPAVERQQQQQQEANSNKKKKKFVSYYRPKAVEGLIKFLPNSDFVDGILQFLQETPHPNHYGADPIQSNNNNNNNTTSTTTNTTTDSAASKPLFPLVLFSHGLSGTIETYTQLCSQIASLGSVVVAPEHADSSASYSTRVDGSSLQEIWYTPPSDSYSRDTIVGYRGPHAEMRVDELNALYSFLKSGKASTYSSSSSSSSSSSQNDDAFDERRLLSVANAVLETIDPLQLHLVGHSFGAATQLLAAQRWAIERSNTKIGNSSNKAIEPIVPLSVTALDSWNFPLSDEILSKGIPNTHATAADNNNDADTPATTANAPILSIVSEEWLTNPEIDFLKEFLLNSRPHCSVDSYYAKHSVHQSFSDSQAWLPNPIATAFENRGPKEDRHVTIRAVVGAFCHHTGIGRDDQSLLLSASSSKPAPIEALADFPFDRGFVS